MISQKLQKETRDKIVAARSKPGPQSNNPRDLWISLYGTETPTIEDFADIFRSVLAEEQQAAEAAAAAAPEQPADDSKSESKKKS